MESSEKRLSVGELAKRSDCKVETVRYYEKVGLMPEPERSAGGHRLYALGHLRRLVFIRRGRELGFSIDQIRELLKLVDEPNHTCGEVKSITLLHANDIQQKIEDLKRLQNALYEMSVKCGGENYTIENCPIVEALYSGLPPRA